MGCIKGVLRVNHTKGNNGSFPTDSHKREDNRKFDELLELATNMDALNELVEFMKGEDEKFFKKLFKQMEKYENTNSD
jgi:hypothetical protein